MNKEQLFNLNRHIKGVSEETNRAIEKWRKDMKWLMEGDQWTDEQKEIIKKRFLTNKDK